MTDAGPRSAWVVAAWALGLAALVAMRLPSLVAPVGSDQQLYMYVGDRILAGGAPYVDAWDQKPPGVHLMYALVRSVWPHASAVPLVDLVASVATAALLFVLGRRLAGLGTGLVAATVFLAFGDPSIARLDGLYVRGQTEVFIALAITLALALTWRTETTFARLTVAGACLAAAVWLKYNAVVYVIPVLVAAWPGRAPISSALVRRLVVPVALGALVVTAPMLAFLLGRDAVIDWWLATVTYNLAYSGDTYTGLIGAVGYAVAMPLNRLRMDFLWYFGAAGAALVLSVRWFSSRTRAVVALWLVAAWGSILINSARDLPQYFVQAKPALALAFGLGIATLTVRPKWLSWSVAGLVAVGLWRVGTDAPGPLGLRWGGLNQAIENVRFDLAYWRGHVSRPKYLARFVGQQKYDAAESDALADLVRRTTAPADRILVLGFSPGVYLDADRVSASRFFWSRPVVVEFAGDRPGYGSQGLLDDLERGRPVIVALQKKDWGPAEPTSHDFMLETPHLSRWLHANYAIERDTPFYSIWRRRR